ncbi:winged helix-turn-helix transcriptional regulator [Haloarcula salinisoli]|uniref:Helix-turn-helix transcriptional regulator n=1 Tax=Haloarcula salinisoli TaxID=2487746 RepID=A0A8J7Y9W4_9EURY|nr:helix-turn-helix domain-containing protein [Halomicroarcula salinisoli]MBX0286382.1 helix-turn-helix transcriptional regulator [Halomicroarcula salinisoli]MBX0302130.1 helix-turn-helix transcriptional regulator [Halomicroarcula salinisoli]
MTGHGGPTGAHAESEPLRRATAILGKKWHPVLLYTLLTDGPLGFNDMKGRIDGISDKVLSEALDDLQEAGLVVRDVVEDKPVRVNYSLTPAGRDLEPIIEELLEWSHEHLTESR